ncbi:hypothetical protein [Micromonospora sp. L32]|uniref:hypothetical protein n=1 Tax=unclassified Micromonospora TaxID=2617518 RepID=UPI003F8A16F8
MASRCRRTIPAASGAASRSPAAIRPATAPGPWAYALCLAAGGFVASTAGQSVTQPDAALDAIRWGFGLLPAAAMLAALLLQRRYTLDRAARAGD